MGIFFLVMPHGPDLVYKESAYGVQPRNNVSLISYSNNVAPPDPVPVSGRGGQALHSLDQWAWSEAIAFAWNCPCFAK